MTQQPLSAPFPGRESECSRSTRAAGPLHTHQLVLISHNPITSHFICLTQRLRSKHFYWESCLTHVHAAPLTLKRMKPSPCACMSLHLGRFLATFFLSIFASHKVRPAADKDLRKNERIFCNSKVMVKSRKLILSVTNWSNFYNLWNSKFKTQGATFHIMRELYLKIKIPC
jgi:hypothetical protein